MMMPHVSGPSSSSYQRTSLSIDRSDLETSEFEAAKHSLAHYCASWSKLIGLGYWVQNTKHWYRFAEG